MLLDDLVRVIELLKERIATHGASLRENETRTRMALVDPLLQALGWDTSDPSLVMPEYSVGNGRADYALMNEDGRPAALIEAKHLSEPLERLNHQEQVFTYALVQQVKFAGLTDGNRWILDNVSDFTGERRILDFSISDAPAHQSVLKLLLLWRPNLASGQPVEAEAPVLVNLPSETPQFPVNVAPTTPDPPTQIPSQASSDHWIPLSQIGRVKGHKPPKAVKFGNGNPRDITAWWQLFYEMAEWLVQRGTLTSDKLPILGIASINATPFGPSGKPFEQAKEVSGGIFIRAKQSSEAIVKSSSNLLQHFHVDPVTVELRFE